MPTLSCPYCNASVPVSEPSAGLVWCPRCGEAVRMPPSAVNGAAVVRPNETNNPLLTTTRPSNWAVARVVLGGMLLLAAITLVYALWTTERRRAYDNPKEAMEPEPYLAVHSVPPAEWFGIGYLPNDTQAIAGVQLAAALESDAGRVLLATLGFAPDASPSPIMGLTASDVDHLLFSASLKTLPPRVTAVVQSRRRLDLQRVRDSILDSRSVERNGQMLTRGKLWSGGLEGVVGQRDDRTLIVVLQPQDFDKVPVQPQAGVNRFTAPLPALLTQRLDSAALVWLAASAEPGNAALGFVTALLPLPPAEGEAWSRLEALALSVRVEGPMLVLTASLRGRDPATSDALADAVVKSLTAAGVTAERSADGDWRTLTATADAAALARWLGTLRGGAGK